MLGGSCGWEVFGKESGRYDIEVKMGFSFLFSLFSWFPNRGMDFTQTENLEEIFEWEEEDYTLLETLWLFGFDLTLFVLVFFLLFLFFGIFVVKESERYDIEIILFYCFIFLVPEQSDQVSLLSDL